MKKILFVVPCQGYGGTHRALDNLLAMLDRKKYEADLFYLHYRGPGGQYRGCRVLPEDPMMSIFYSFREAVQGESPWGILKKTCLKVYMRLVLRSRDDRIYASVGKRLSRGGYDVVVGFQESLATQVAARVAAPRRLAWVHCDYGRHIAAKGNVDETELYRNFHRIVAVSQYTARVFRDCLPQVADRVVGLHNLMDQKAIRELSREPVTDPRFRKATWTLVSVGRLDPVKRFSEIPRMAAYLRDRGIPLRWYIIGDGAREQQVIEENIEKFRVSQQVILLGAKQNPYPYMARADVIVVPSLSEACPNVVNEAMILHVPVAAADFPSARELITPGVNGMIAPIEELPELLARLYEDKGLFGSLRQQLEHYEYNNGELYSAIENLLDGEET